MITSDRMAAVDRNAAALGVSQKQLMESSGNAVATLVRDVATPGSSVAVVAGRGNNGGDAFVAARFLDDYDVRVHLLGRPESITTEIARENWNVLDDAEYDTTVVRDPRSLDIGAPDVIVDGLLGTGITGPPREPERTAIELINGTEATVISVDVPSGMDANTGEVSGVVVDADRVITFHDVKPGLADLGGVTVADIGIPEAAERFVGPGDLLGLTREPEAHKGDFGRIFVIGGGPYTGAPALVGQAALRSGADLAYVATPSEISNTVQGYSEELIVEPFDGRRLTPAAIDTLLRRAGDRDVVILGPGLGDADETLEAVLEFLEGFEGRAVIDADALQAVPVADTSATLVCTPHQGELVEMGGPRADEWRERVDAVSEYAGELGQTLLVKGSYDIISDGSETRVNRTGNPGMTVGGTGDVLAGITGALLARLPPVRAAGVAAHVTGRAGDTVVAEMGYGLLASDLLPEVPRVLWREG